MKTFSKNDVLRDVIARERLIIAYGIQSSIKSLYLFHIKNKRHETRNSNKYKIPIN
jgi:hypothetical protein